MENVAAFPLHGQHNLKLVDLAVPVQFLVLLLLISKSPTAGSALMGVATTLTHSAIDSVVPPAVQVVADSL